MAMIFYFMLSVSVH